MNKRHLSDQQKQQIQWQQTQYLGQTLSGLVVAHYGDSIDVESDVGHLFNCNIRQNLPPIVVGDVVSWRIQETAQQAGVVLALAPRRNKVWRRNQRGETKLIAANIDFVIVVVAAGFKHTEHSLDRYLMLAQLQNLPVIIIFNKVDLFNVDELTAKQAHYVEYEKLGYPILFCSNLVQQSIALLSHTLQNKTSVVVGLSGVGKSSLIKALLPDKNIRLGSVAKNSRSCLGKHTTTTARLYHLINGGNIIDSPGIREFTVKGLTQTEIEQGFREFAPYSKHCKFRNCQHHREPGCAIRPAVEIGAISQARWETYQQIRASNSKKHL